MDAFLGAAYLWVKALHVISVICWMAAMLYLPRLFVYHCEATSKGELSEKLKIMEYRLAKYIMTPSMIGAYITGILLILTPGLVLWSFGWIHVKLLLVLILSASHGILLKHVKTFAQDKNKRSQKFFRTLNEVPTILMIGIVIMVIVKPF
jgi:putative membrane protein